LRRYQESLKMSKIIFSFFLLILCPAFLSADSNTQKQYNEKGNLVAEQIRTSPHEVTQNLYDGTAKTNGSEGVERKVEFYREDGTVERQVFLKDYQLDRLVQYNEDGDVESTKTRAEFETEEEEYRSGRKNGTFKTIDEQGQWKDVVYQKGKVVPPNRT
jgi:hypothetical protein